MCPSEEEINWRGKKSHRAYHLFLAMLAFPDLTQHPSMAHILFETVTGCLQS
jgi:hypothetical protein